MVFLPENSQLKAQISSQSNVQSKQADIFTPRSKMLNFWGFNFFIQTLFQCVFAFFTTVRAEAGAEGATGAVRTAGAQ